jgi:hypothetical protein
MIRRRAPLLLLPVLCAFGSARPAAAAQVVPAADTGAAYRVQRLSGPIELDGRSDEPAWQAIEPLRAVSSYPNFGAAPSELTEFRLAYDDEFLYVSGRLYDTEPSGIRATSLRRDDGSFTNDWFVINLDMFRDRENTMVFGVSPAGVRTDAAFSNDGQNVNFDWNAFWDARAVVDADGWHAEIRIPLSSLRFEERDGVVVMGVSIWRRIARRNEMISWPAIEHRWGTNSIFKASQMTEMVLEGVTRRNPVYVTPYLLTGPGRTNALNTPGDAWVSADDFTREVGLDVKYSPTSNLTLDLTANTDFAQVEADDQQVNLSRFSLFFPEKRLFFQERASVFDYGLGGSDRLFYSRRIGLEDGVPVRIYGGGRAVGRVGEWDMGVLNMQMAEADGGASQNAGVVRLRRRMLNDNSYAGGMITTRIGSDGAVQLSAGADALVRVIGQDYLTVAAAATANDGAAGSQADRLFTRVRWERRGIYGLLYDAELAHVGHAFVPALGFLARRDHARAVGRVEYGLSMPQASRVLRHSFELSAGAYHGYSAGRLESGEIAAEWTGEGRDGSSLSLDVEGRREHLLEPFTLAGNVDVPAGAHDFASVRLSYSPPSSALFRLTTSAEAGSFFDGNRYSASASPTWIPNRHLQLSGTWQVNRLRFAVRDQHVTTHVSRLRTQVMLNSMLSGSAFIQYNSAARAVGLNARLRYNASEGRDLYIVFNQGFNTDRFDAVPIRPLTSSRALLIKYSHTL